MLPCSHVFIPATFIENFPYARHGTEHRAVEETEKVAALMGLASQHVTLTSPLECPLPQDVLHALEGAKELLQVRRTSKLAITPFTYPLLLKDVPPFPDSVTLLRHLITFCLEQFQKPVGRIEIIETQNYSIIQQVHIFI